MPIVQKFTKANTQLRRIHSVEVAFVTDPEFSTAMLLTNDRELTRRYFEQLRETISHSDAPGRQWELVYFVRGVSLLGHDIPVDEGVIQRVRDTFKKD